MKGLESLLPHEADEIDDPAGITPLIVIPRKYLDEITVNHVRIAAIEDGRVGVAAEID
jgi:hypothetical protein